MSITKTHEKENNEHLIGMPYMHAPDYFAHSMDRWGLSQALFQLISNECQIQPHLLQRGLISN
jgi:hypothetical protein